MSTRFPLSRASYGWTLTTLWTGLLAILRVVPNRLAGFIIVIAVALAIIARQTPISAAVRLALLCLTSGGVYWSQDLRLDRQTGCAVLAAMLALKTAELRQVRDGQILVGFSLMAPFAASLLKEDSVTAILGGLTLCFACVCMQQLTSQHTPLPSPVWRVYLETSKRVLGWGIPLTVCAFIVLPRLSVPLWGREQRVSEGGILHDMAPGQLLDVLLDDTPAFFVRFHQTPPTPQSMYWRGSVLWDFDGQVWHENRNNVTPIASFRIDPSPTRVYDYDIMYAPTQDHSLVALDTVLRSPPGSHLTPDMSLQSDRLLDTDTQWHLQSSPLLRFEPFLHPRRAQRALELPRDSNPQTVALGRQWGRELHHNPRALIARALHWIHASFRYTLDTPAPVHDEIDQFLFQRQSGFCAHYSAALTVLMRAAGIPARVVTGYVGATFDPQRQQWIVRRRDAHAWSEVWLEEKGWLRVDPTAAIATERREKTSQDRIRADNHNVFSPAGWHWPQLGIWAKTQWNAFLHYGANQQQQLLTALPASVGQRLRALARHLAWLLAGGGCIVFIATWQRREKDPVRRAWHQLEHRYARLGFKRHRHEPICAWAARVNAHRPSPDLLTLSQNFVAFRYAGKDCNVSRFQKAVKKHRPFCRVCE